MSNNPSEKKFKQWLDILQQESWQLELIISGFAIYGLFMVIDPIKAANLEANDVENVYSTLLFQGLIVSWYIITINLIAHVILRGLWIGAIGLRYVSGDIDYEELGYSPKFQRHLKKRVGSFDNYVARLEKYCSVIFAVTFILVFYLLGLLLLTLLFVLLGLSMDKEETPQWVKLGVVVPLLVYLGIGMLLTFIDFITQGWLKKKKWTTFFYFPFYWVFKYITLSFLYRPMVYNFLDTRFGRRLSFVIVPLYIGISIIADTGFSISNYLEKDMGSNSFTANSSNYLDMTAEKNLEFVDRASIPSKVISDRFLNVFIVYGTSVEDDVFYFSKDIEPEEDRRGIYSTFSSGTVSWDTQSDNIKKYMETLEDMYTLSIDSVDFKPKLVLTENSKNQLGYETFLDLSEIEKGKHNLRVRRKDINSRDSVYVRTVITIPFWYYPD